MRTSTNESLIDLHPKSLVNTSKAAKWLAVSERCLQNWRVSGKGPRYVCYSRRAVRYTIADLIAFSESHFQNSTSQKKVRSTSKFGRKR